MENNVVVVLTSGTYFTNALNAGYILEAVARNDRLVEIDVDVHGDGLSVRRVHLALQNFVMLFEGFDQKRSEAVAIMGGKVRTLR